MTKTPLFPRPLKENIVPAQAHDLLTLIRAGLKSGRFQVVNGTIVLSEEVKLVKHNTSDNKIYAK